MSLFTIRPARPPDAGLILALLTELAEYENLPITITEADIAFDFFGLRPQIECELGFEGDTPVGLVTYYWTYATFRAARRLYLEDLFVRPPYRGKGHGTALLQYLARKGLAAGAARLEWQVLDWNKSAIEFYNDIGAHPHEGWFTYWLEGEAMKKLGGKLSVTLILAAADNGVIGKAGAIPWRIPEDMKRFKALTLGKNVVMGRKTWDLLPKKPLPERRNIVVTRQPGWRDDGAEVMPLEQALSQQDVMVIGGAEIYRAALGHADRIELTEVHRAFDGDATFTFDCSGWKECAREDHVTPNGLAYSYVTLIR